MDYRLFLKDMFRFRKKKNKHFSHRFFAAKAGFSSSNYLNLVMQGKRNLTNASVPKVAKGFGLKTKEREFFENLVFMNQSKTLDEKKYYYKKIVSIRGYTDAKKLEKASYDYYSNWYNIAIREMITFGGKKYTAAQIAAKLDPKVSAYQVKRSLKLLMELGMIKRDAEGKWERQDSAVTTGPEVQSLMVANFHKKMLQLAAESIDRHNAEARDITTITMSVNNNTMTEIKERIAAFRREIVEMANNDTNANQVIQLNMQAFPLTKPPERKR